MKISQAGIDLIKAFEGLGDGDPTTVLLEPYQDPVGLWTIGWGHLIRPGKAMKKFSEGITLATAERLLRTDVRFAEHAVDSYVEVELNQNEFDALVSFVFNVGGRAFFDSTLLQILNRTGNRDEAGAQFLRWVFAKGQRLIGLENRRAKERELFLKNPTV